MKTSVYYFSGTGNSLSIARELVSALGGGEAVSITDMLSEKRVAPSSEAVGLVYPVYALGIPLIVERFIEKLHLGPGTYVFTVANYAMVQGAGITKAHRCLRHRGIMPKAGFGIRMPNSYIPFGATEPEEKRKRLFAEAKRKVKRIAEAAERMEELPPETGFFLARWLLAEPICFFSSAVMPGEDKNFKTTKKCNGCGICERVCPVGNIELKDSRPFWKHCCEQCMACFSWCPEEAIEFGRSTRGRKRYRNPSVTLQDMLRR